MEKGVLIIPVGIPGSGKSTFSAKLKDAVVVSSDAIRGEFFGDENLQYEDGFAMRKIKRDGIDITKMSEEELELTKRKVCASAVFGTLNYCVARELKHGKTVVYDATNISRRGRVKLLEKFRGLYDHAEVYYFKVPKDVAIERNNGRKRKVPVEVIDRMFDELEEPTVAEGFSVVHTIEA